VGACTAPTPCGVMSCDAVTSAYSWRRLLLV
jgi:hypothetical protein